MRLAEELRPKRVADLVGQPKIKAILTRFVERPFASAWLLTGPPGTGKTSIACAVSNELEVDKTCDETVIGCANLTLDVAKRAISGLRCRPMFSKWRMLILEEFEQLTPLVQMALKVDLDPLNLPKHAIVIATSNNVGRIQEAVKQRFQRLAFGGDDTFAAEANRIVAAEWRKRTGTEPPDGYEKWGWQDDSFSLRSAWDQMEIEVMLLA